MSETPPAKPVTGSEGAESRRRDADREQRRAEALRDNLKRRKDQTRARAAESEKRSRSS